MNSFPLAKIVLGLVAILAVATTGCSSGGPTIPPSWYDSAFDKHGGPDASPTPYSAPTAEPGN
ncbi:MAG: hypothetical protein KF791_19040 [Verrucomicrobiae bacterium]|nr:hypothetical protein [Verrucomicrobiae bacterium]